MTRYELRTHWLVRRASVVCAYPLLILLLLIDPNPWKSLWQDFRRDFACLHAEINRVWKK